MILACLLLTGVALVAPATSAIATHACGFDPCPHVYDVTCVLDSLLEKVTGKQWFYCPY